MKVIEFIKQNGFNALTEQLGISVKFVDDLVLLNYNQIDSPKTDPIVIECRSLILNRETLEVVSRGFDRFFNLGEAQNVMPVIDWSRAKLFDKVDGSLIKIYHHNDKWNISTRGTAYAESDCMGYGITFKELVLKALDCEDDAEFQKRCKKALMWEFYTYIFELTSVENRVVKRYEGYKLHYLSARSNLTGKYYTESEEAVAVRIGATTIGQYSFASEAECVRTAAHLKDLDEGYVLYQDGVPICKIKSPAYVAVHHIRGEGLNPKRISQLVLSGESDEYLSYFPDDEVVIEPYVQAYGVMLVDIRDAYRATKHIEDQKEFALAVAKHKFKGVLFTARSQGIDWFNAFEAQRDSFKIDLLKGYL